MIREKLRAAGAAAKTCSTSRWSRAATTRRRVVEAGAVGMWQFVEVTAVDYGIEKTRWVDRAHEPRARHRRRGALLQGPARQARLVAAGAGRLQHGLRRAAALDPQVQHQRLLAALAARGRPAVRDHRSTWPRSWRARSSRTTRSASASATCKKDPAARASSYVARAGRHGLGGWRARRAMTPDATGRAQPGAAAQARPARRQAVEPAHPERAQAALRQALARAAAGRADPRDRTCCASASASRTWPRCTARPSASCAR